MITQDIAKQILPPAPSIPSNIPMLPGQVPLLPQTALGFGFPGYQLPIQAFPLSGVPLPMQHIPGINQPSTLPADPLAEVLGEDQRQLLDQVMQLTPEQIDKLQPQERQQIMQLRQTMMTLNWGIPR